MKVKITQRMVNLYARVAKALNEADERQKARRKKIIERLIAGAELPTGGPWLIELSQNGGKVLDWKGIYEASLIKAYSRRYPNQTEFVLQQVRERIQEIEKAAPAKPAVIVHGKSYIGGVKLNCRQNPNFKEGQVIPAQHRVA